MSATAIIANFLVLGSLALAAILVSIFSIFRTRMPKFMANVDVD